MSFLTISGISKQVEKNFVLKDISFTQQSLQKIAIAGETGSGKSTLLKIIAGLIQPHAGEVWFEQERVLGPLEKLIPGHPRIGYLSQHFELRNNYTVEEVLLMANKIPGEEAALIYDVCRISHLLKRKTDQLSGGEKQRIATARLLISRPRLLLLDEPYSNLDMHHKTILKSVIHDIAESLKITCIMISHDPMDTLSWADEIFVMKDGEIIQKGTPEQVYNQPVSEYAGGLLGSYNLIDSEQAKAIGGIDGIKMPGKKRFVRPENLRLIRGKTPDLNGTVVEVTYYGSYYEIKALISETVISVKTTENNIYKGDPVGISVCSDKEWYV